MPTETARELVPRPHLAAAIGDALDRGALMLTAGAGFGKTTILEQGLAERQDAQAWVSCTLAERDPGALLARLVEAVRSAVPGVAGAFSERLAGSLDRIDAQAAARTLLAELEEVLLEPLIVVIDDAEHLDGAEEGLELLRTLLDTTGERVRPAIASRRMLPLRLAKQRASGRLTVLGSSDLAFTPEECAQLLSVVRNRETGLEDVEELVEATEGWPLGVALFARHGERTASGALSDAGPERFPSSEQVHQFFAEEVLDTLDPALREAAIDAAITRRLSPGVVASLGAPETFPDELERAGVPIGSPDSDGVRAYHPLFREFLLGRVAAERDEERRRELHARVAGAVAEDGDTLASIEHWLAAQEWARAVAALQEQGPWLSRTAPSLLRSLLDRLPPDVRGDPTIMLLEGQLEWGGGDHPAAARMLRAASAGYRARGEPAGDWAARLTLATSLHHIGATDEAVELTDGFDGPEAAAFGFVPATVAMIAAVALASEGREEESERLAERLRDHPAASLLRGLESMRRDHLETPRGRLDELLEYMADSLEELERADPINFRLYVMASLALVLDDAGRRDQALEVWGRLAALAAEGLVPFMVRHGHNWRALLFAQAGRLPEAEAELARGGVPERGWWSYEHDVARAAVAALRGDAREAAEAAERALRTVRGGAIAFRFWAAAHLVPVLAEAGMQARAGEVLADALTLLDERLPGERGCFFRARLLALRAWLQQRAGEHEGARADLRACWEEAGDSRRFVLRREWEHLEGIIWIALEQGDLEPGKTMEAIAAAFPEGTVLAPFAAHPAAAVRRNALEPALASGHPEAARHLEELLGDEDPDVVSTARRAADRLASIVPPLSFRVLGGFEVGRGAWRATERHWERPVDARLVRFLLVRRGAPVPEDAIFEELWPELSLEGARRSLRVAASRARRVLDRPRAERSVIQVTDGAYQLVLGERDTVDAEVFEAAATAALTEHGPARRRLLERARELWQGEPLPADRYEEWTAAWRERLSDRHIEVLSSLTDIHLGAREHPEAIRTARELIELDPLNEAAHRSLTLAYARAGRRGHALRQYLECRRALVEQLGVEPSEEISRLHAQVLAGAPV